MGTDPRRIGTVLITRSCNIWNTRMNHAVRGCMRAGYYGQPFPNTPSTTKFRNSESSPEFGNRNGT